MTVWIWTCAITLIWIPAAVRTRAYNDGGNSQSRSRASQPRPPTVPGQGDGLPFRPGGGYKGPGNGRSASFGFNAYKGPTHGDFDSSVRSFSKAHTLGSFGNSFEGTNDHASVMNQVYGRLQNNGAGHYNQEPVDDDANNNYDQSNSNNGRNNYNLNGYNSNNGPTRNDKYQSKNYNKRGKQQQNNRDPSQSKNNAYSQQGNSNNFFGSSGKDSSFPGFGSSHDKNMFPKDLFDFSNPADFTSQGGDSSDSSYNQRRQSPPPRRRTRPRGSGYRSRPRNYPARQKSGYYPNRGSYQSPQHLSSQYKGFGGYGYGGGYAAPRAPSRGRPYFNPTGDRLTSTAGGATLLQVTNTRIPKTGEGSGFGNMVEDGGRGKAIIAITSTGSNERSLGSGGGFNYDNILEDDHSLTDIVSAVATVVGQGSMNPSALGTFAGGGGGGASFPAAQRPIANNLRQPRHRSAPGMYTGNNAYNAGNGYSGGTYVSNHHPMNNGDGGAFISNHQSLNNPSGGGGGYGSKEPSLSHINGENSLVSFEDSIQNLVLK